METAVLTGTQETYSLYKNHKNLNPSPTYTAAKLTG